MGKYPEELIWTVGRMEKGPFQNLHTDEHVSVLFLDITRKASLLSKKDISTCISSLERIKSHYRLISTFMWPQCNSVISAIHQMIAIVQCLLSNGFGVWNISLVRLKRRRMV